MTTYTSVRQVIDPFIREYRKQNDNRSPFIEPVIRERQQFGREQTEETFDAAVRCGTSFSKWVNEVLLTSADPDEIPLLLFPQSFGIPNYRDSYGRSTVFWDKFSLYSFGYLGGCPDYTVPIGEVPYMSRITEREAFLPVSLSIIGRKGHDLVLFDILKGLDRQGILKEVKTGSRLFPTSNQ
ncbi:MAG: hypothetical protein M1838_001087 [Thelocarpon superellum]|nr:MAG: hypothetical protein M1838_001087 [Thelocarpon superellum]